MAPEEEGKLQTIDINALREVTPDSSSNASNIAKDYDEPHNCSSKVNKVVKAKRWTWTDDMIEALLHNVTSYKADKEYEGIDFEADLVQFYDDIREMMSDMYPMVENSVSLSQEEWLT